MVFRLYPPHRSICGLIASLLLILPTLAWSARKAAAAPAATAATPNIFPAAFTETIERGIANGAYSAVAVGVIDGKQRRSFYFGHRDGAQSAPPDDNSRFEIGATSDVFTGLLLAQAVLEGKLRLADPVRKFLPEGFPFADTRVAETSIQALATQRSALPSQAPNLFPANLSDPFVDYATEDLLALLAYYKTGVGDTESNYAYSVINGGLLGSLLGRAYAAPYAEVLNTKVLAPLGLKQTSLRDDEALLPGHARGAAAAHWHFGALAGAAGLRSTLPDLLQFLQHNLTPSDSALRAALLLARQPRASGEVDQIALGWNVRDVADESGGWPLAWRASTTAGFASFIGFRTDKQRAIVLLGNAAEDVAAIGIAWLTDTLPPSAPRGYADGAGNDSGAYPGLYEMSAGSDIIIRNISGGLSLQMPGELPLRLHSVDRDVYASDNGAAGVTFMRRIDEITGLVLHLNGTHASARRLSVRAPRLARVPMQAGTTPTDILGEYRLDADNWMRVANPDGHLTLQLTMGERYAIFAYAPDRFADTEGAIDLSFTRDPSGRVVGAMLDLAGAQRDGVPLHGSLR